MGIFTKKMRSNDKEDFRFVGAYVPPQTFAFFSLFVLSKKLNKSIIIKELLDNWKKEIEKEHTEFGMIETLKIYVQNQWQKSTKISLQTFKNKANAEMKKKGLSSDMIHQILKDL